MSDKTYTKQEMEEMANALLAEDDKKKKAAARKRLLKKMRKMNAA